MSHPVSANSNSTPRGVSQAVMFKSPPSGISDNAWPTSVRIAARFAPGQRGFRVDVSMSISKQTGATCWISSGAVTDSTRTAKERHVFGSIH